MFKSMTMIKKIALGFSLVLVFTITVGTIGYWGIRQTSSIAEIAHDCSSMSELALQCRRREKDFMLREDTKYQQKLHQDVGQINEIIKQTTSRLETQQDHEAIAKLSEHVSNYKRSFDSYVNIWDQQKDQEKAMVGAARKAIGGGFALLDLFKEQLSRGQETAAASFDSRQWKVNTAKELLLLALEGRKTEKDYVVRGDLKYIKNHRSLIVSFRQACNK